jgi:succinyl-CoA synthetase beta subunit
MNIHEHQAKALLREAGVPVPRGHPAFSVEEAAAAAADLGTPVLVVKAQIHAGGRGKAGGIKVVRSVEEVRREAQRLLGATLITRQTGPRGKEVKRLYVEEGTAIARELYLSALVDRGSSRIAFVVSTAGGMDIEEVARESPSASSPSPSIRRPASCRITGGAWLRRWALPATLPGRPRRSPPSSMPSSWPRT